MPGRKSTKSQVTHVESLDFRIWKTVAIVMPTAHTHADIEINFMTKGQLRYFIGGHFVELHAGDVGLFWGGIPHQSIFKSADVEGITVTIPLLWLLHWPHAARLADIILQGRVVSYRATPLQADQFITWLTDYESGDRARKDLITCEMEAHLSRVALSYTESSKTSNKTPFMAKNAPLQKALAFISANYCGEKFTVADISRAAGLHEKYLLALFHRTCGMTLWDFVLQLRLAHAQRLLLTTDQKITDIALDSGFGSLSSFYHAFSKLPDAVSPAALRARRFITPLRGSLTP